MLLKYAEMLAMVLGIAFLATQVVLPALRGGRMFPLFRRRGRLERELADALEERNNDKLATKIRRAEGRKNVDR